MGSRRSPRIITRAIVFLLLGAIVNIAVAWGCSIWSSARYDEASIQSCDVDDVDEHCRREAVKMRLQGKRWSLGHAGVIGAEWHQMISTDTGDSFLKRSGAYHIQLAGWPMSSMYCSGVPTIPPTISNGSMRIGIEWQGGLRCPSYLHPQHAYSYVLPEVERPLPVTPLIPGFAINTLFYAGILWLLFAVPFALRRRRRTKRGLCPACAYPIGASDVCTECGEVVRRMAGTT